MKRSTTYNCAYMESPPDSFPNWFFTSKPSLFYSDYRIREESGMNIFELLYRHYSPIGIQGRFFWDNLNRKQIDTYETE